MSGINTASCNTTILWTYYQKCYDESGEFLKKVECLNCSKTFAYRSSDYHGSLWRHLKQVHAVERENNPYIPARKSDPAPQQQRRKKLIKVAMPAITEEGTVRDSSLETSPQQVALFKTGNLPLYRYFTLYNGGRVKCRVCMSAGLPTPILTNQAKNMTTHLKTHPRAYKLYELEEQFGKSGPEFDERIHLPNTTSSPGIFAQASDGKYHCQICQIKISGIMAMKKHLKQNHAITEQDVGNDVIYTETVSIGDRNKTVTKIFSNENGSIKESVKNRNLANEDVDAFGNYVTTLLKSMPKEDSTKLQQTILNKIIEAKLEARHRSTEGQESSITEVESEEAIIAIVENDDDDNAVVENYDDDNAVVENDDYDDDRTDVGDDTDEETMTEKCLEYTDEDNVQNEVVVGQEPVAKRFKYANDNILELS